jgi:cytochrome P450
VTSRTSRDIPIPPGHWLRGNLPDYARDPLGSFRRWTAEYGDAVRLRFGPVTVLLLTGPAAVEDLAVHRAADFRKAPLIRRLSHPVIGDSLFTAEGTDWQRQRDLLEPAFTRERMEAATGSFSEAAEQVTGRWRADQQIDVLDQSMDLSQQLVARMLFGSAFPRSHVETVGAALAVTAADFQRWANSPLMALPEAVPLPRGRAWRDAVRDLDRVIQDAVARRREAPPSQEDLLGHLLQLQQTTPWLTDRLIRDNMLMLLVQGREDPALLATWALYLVARHPQEATLVAAEADASDDRLPRTDAVLREALRLYPPVYSTGRQAIRDTVVDGTRIRRGTIVLTSQAVTHRDPRWFDEPDTFRPDRWLDGRPRDLPPGSYVPFGIGPRRCLGEHLAWGIARAIVTAVLRRWELHPADPEPVEPAVVLSLRPSRPVVVRLSARTR